MKKQFYVYKRNGGSYYVQFTDPVTGKLLTPRSTRKKTKAEAIEIAYKMLYSSEYEQKSSVSYTQSFLKLVLENKISQSDILQLQNSLCVYTNSHLQMNEQSEKQRNENVKSKTPLLEWLKDFWTYETSEYVQDKLSHGKRISQNYCYVQTNSLKYWSDFFDFKFALEDLNTDKLQEFEQYLFEKRTQKKRTIIDEATGKKEILVEDIPLSTITRNNIIKTGSIAFEWATRKKILVENPCKSLTAYSFKAKKRDILNRKEVHALFTTGTWKNERARVANLLAMTTGLRVSEILALRIDDIGEDRLYISHSYNHARDGLTCTKNGESRIVPLVPKVKSELEKLYWSNPHKAFGDKFIFYSNIPNKPIVPNAITEGLKSAMESIGISETQRQERNIVFHSWRHFYATTIATELSEKHAQLTLGHLTQAMTKHYADHKTEEALMTVCNASNDIFTEMIG